MSSLTRQNNDGRYQNEVEVAADIRRRRIKRVGKIMKKNTDYFKKLAIVILKLAPEYGIYKAGVFGSVANGTFKKTSDIDILVVFRMPIGFIKFLQLESALSRALGRKVDLVTEAALSPYIKNDVLKQLKVVYEEK